MKKIGFRVVPHRVLPDAEIVEVLLNGEVCATICQDKDSKTIKVVSAHFTGELTHDGEFPEGVKMDTGENMFPPIPAVFISFDPRPWMIVDTTLVREK